MGAGVLEQHRERMQNDPEYRDAALTAPHPIRGKYLTNTAPTAFAADRSEPAGPAVAGQVQEPRPIDATLPPESVGVVAESPEPSPADPAPSAPEPVPTPQPDVPQPSQPGPDPEAPPSDTE